MRDRLRRINPDRSRVMRGALIGAALITAGIIVERQYKVSDYVADSASAVSLQAKRLNYDGWRSFSDGALTVSRWADPGPARP